MQVASTDVVGPTGPTRDRLTQSVLGKQTEVRA